MVLEYWGRGVRDVETAMRVIDGAANDRDLDDDLGRLQGRDGVGLCVSAEWQLACPHPCEAARKVQLEPRQREALGAAGARLTRRRVG